MSDSEKLKIMLKDLIPCIEGPWFLADGCLLGLIRQRDLLEFDDDIDIFILPETKIHWDKLPDKYEYYKDYMCYKIYDRLGREPPPISNWIRYNQYVRLLPENRGLNRADLLKVASQTYREESIKRKYKMPWLDVFVLEKDVENEGQYNIPYYLSKDRHDLYTKENLQLKINYDLGFPVNIPNKAEEVLERQYGKDWMIENKNFSY